jgi:hypothetical protein
VRSELAEEKVIGWSSSIKQYGRSIAPRLDALMKS